jgi:hypothetical protein
MISGTKRARTTARWISFSKNRWRRGRQHFAQEEHDQPARPPPHHGPERHLEIRLLQRLQPAEPLQRAGSGSLGHVQDVVDGDDPDQRAVGVRDGEGDAVLLLEQGDRRLLGVRGLERDDALVHDVGHSRVGREEQDLPDGDLADEPPPVVDDVHDRERLAVVAVAPNVVEHVGHGPVRPDADVVRREEPPDAALGVAEQLDGHRALFRGEKLEQLLGHGRRQLVQQRGAVVRRHLVQDLGDFLLGHGLEQLPLGLEWQVLEDVRGQIAGQHPEGEDLLVHRQPLDQTSGGRRRRVLQHLLEGDEISRLDDAGEIRRGLDGHGAPDLFARLDQGSS